MATTATATTVGVSDLLHSTRCCINFTGMGDPAPMINNGTSDNITGAHIPKELLPLYGHYIIGTLLAIIAVLGIAQNILVLYLHSNEKGPKNQTEQVVNVLVVADLLMCLLSIPFAVVSSFSGKWIFGDIACKWYGFSMGWLGLFNVYLLTAISIERYRQLSSPVNNIVKISKKTTAGLVCGCLLVAFILAILPLLGVNAYVLEGVGTSCGIHWTGRSWSDFIYVILLLVLAFLVPSTIMIYCYSKIHQKVSDKDWKTRMSHQPAIHQRRVEMETRMTKLIAFSGAAFLGAWGPYCLVALAMIIGDPEEIPPVLLTVPSIFAKSCVFWNATAFIYHNQKTGSAFKTLLGSVCGKACKAKVHPTIRNKVDKTTSGRYRLEEDPQDVERSKAPTDDKSSPPDDLTSF